MTSTEARPKGPDGVHGILCTLRNGGEFVGELGETFLFTPPSGSIPAKRFMVIGLGDEKDLSLDALHPVGRIAGREAVRLQAKHVAWAPVIRDEGNTDIDVGAGNRAFIEQLITAYDTEKRLSENKVSAALALKMSLLRLGRLLRGCCKQVGGEGIKSVAGQLTERNGTRYSSARCNETGVD